jgi:hypothetical protein
MPYGLVGVMQFHVIFCPPSRQAHIFRIMF